MSDIALQRVGPLRHIPKLLATLGVSGDDVELLLAGLGRALDNPDNYIPFADATELLSRCARRTECIHFGLLVGDLADNRDLGLPGALMNSAATVAQALFDFASCQLRNSNGAVVYLAKAEENTFLGYGIYDRRVAGTHHVYDLAAAVGVNLLRRLGGPSARPSEVLLSHRGPADRHPYYRIHSPSGMPSDVSFA